jgi:hypothetical protein
MPSGWLSGSPVFAARAACRQLSQTPTNRWGQSTGAAPWPKGKETFMCITPQLVANGRFPPSRNASFSEPTRRCRVFGCYGIRNEISLAAMILPAPGETKRDGPRVFRMLYLPSAPDSPDRYLQCAALNRSLNEKPRQFPGYPKMAGLPDVVGPTGIEPMTSTV